MWNSKMGKGLPSVKFAKDMLLLPRELPMRGPITDTNKLQHANYALEMQKHSSATKFTVTTAPQQPTSETDVLNAMTLLVTSQNLSPEVAATPEMLELLQKTRNLAPQVSSLHLSADSVKKTISKLFEEYFRKLHETIKAIDSFTTDGWSSSTRRPFLGINAPWIDKNFSLQSVTFDFVEIHGGHSGANIAQTFFESVQKLGAHQKVSQFFISYDLDWRNYC
jgi:hypothetical protein